MTWFAQQLALGNCISSCQKATWSIVPDAGHSMGEASIARELVKATEEI